MSTIKLENQNSVELIDYMGSDKLHSLAAWASTFMEFGIEMPDNPHLRVDEIVDHILNNGKKKRSIEELLSFLAENSHSSPFRFSSFVFGMTTDIATHIQKLKHTVILEAENAESARYKHLKDDLFYLPQDWKEYGEIGNKWYNILKEHSENSTKLYHQAIEELSKTDLSKSRIKDTTRFFRGYNSQLRSLNKFSFDGIIQFHNKRGSEHAQKEIGFIANEMIRCIKEIPNHPFQYSLKAFNI